MINKCGCYMAQLHSTLCGCECHKGEATRQFTTPDPTTCEHSGIKLPPKYRNGGTLDKDLLINKSLAQSKGNYSIELDALLARVKELESHPAKFNGRISELETSQRELSNIIYRTREDTHVLTKRIEKLEQWSDNADQWMNDENLIAWQGSHQELCGIINNVLNRELEYRERIEKLEQLPKIARDKVHLHGKTTGMTLAEAIQAMDKGKKVSRRGGEGYALTATDWEIIDESK